MRKSVLCLIVMASVLVLLSIGTAHATESRDAVGTAFTYQGRLTDGGANAAGTYDLRFILYDAEAGGAQVGPTIEKTSVTVTDGLVTADLDFGNVEGASALWLEVAVRATGSPTYATLSPRQRLRPGPQDLWAANSATLENHPASFFLDTSSTAQTKTGPLTIFASTGTGMTVQGGDQGGFFGNTATDSWAQLALSEIQGGLGIYAFGTQAGAEFDGPSSTAFVGIEYLGIYAAGTVAGGHFQNWDSSGDAWVASGDLGISATGNEAGGYFHDADETGEAYVGYGGWAIYGTGSSGAFFYNSDGTSTASIADSGQGVAAAGTVDGGYFANGDPSNEAHVGTSSFGIDAKGTSAGGCFRDANGTGEAYGGYGDIGILARGSYAGGYFDDSDTSGQAYVAIGNTGVQAYGDSRGGYFQDANSSSYGYVGYSIYKIYGNGTVDFVQNHPDDPGRVIAYSAPEGDEVAVYTRGSARLSGGEATVPLGETFRWVTDPDIGLTAYVTPREPGCTLYVPEIATDSLTVQSSEGSDCTFDYIVWGLRIGFEDTTVVQPKQQESYIPSMNDHRDMIAEQPELARYTARSRYLKQRSDIGYKSAPDTSRSQALIAAIHEFDPAVDQIERPEMPEMPTHIVPTAASPTSRIVTRAGATQRSTALASSREPLAAAVSADRDLDARSFRSQLGRVATRVAVDGPVQPGDVLAIDPDQPELLKRASANGDPTVVGIVVDTAGVTLGEAEVKQGQARALLATPGAIVPCRVDAGYGAIAPGDLLVSSPTPGRAMRASDPLPGSVVAKAIQPLADGEGTIRVLVMLR